MGCSLRLPPVPSLAPPAWLADRFEVFERPSRLAERVAELLEQELSAAPARPLGLATGRTMEPVYDALVQRLLALSPQRLKALQVGWRSFNLDEYIGLGPTDSGSFALEMSRQLVRPLGLEPGCVRLPDGLAEDPSAEASRYAAAVRAAGGSGCSCWAWAAMAMWASTSPLVARRRPAAAWSSAPPPAATTRWPSRVTPPECRLARSPSALSRFLGPSASCWW